MDVSRLPSYTGPLGRIWHYVFLLICAFVFLLLIGPLFVIIPLSFNADSYFTFSEGMLRLDPDAFSLKWYRELFGTYEAIRSSRPESRGSEWASAAGNSFFIAICSTVIATSLGTLAAVGLSRSHMPFRRLIMAVLISPMIVPIIITAAGIFVYYSKYHLAYTHLGLILAHAALGTPFVVITVTAVLMGFDQQYVRASYSLGARPLKTFRKVVLPLTFPGIITGAIFAFVTSFDEVVVVIFLGGENQVTLPRLIWSGIRQEITLTILAVATIMVLLSVVVLFCVELLRRRHERFVTQPLGAP
ncbi:MAG: ABC transporter permease [Gammaproteobacteria bacterium]|jgi:putative spermidine/putrescine transport system permease protein|nr:ABC transporter permease [Gammaproteobacteria bacterium]